MPIEYIELSCAEIIHSTAVDKFTRLLRDGQLEHLVGVRQKLEEGRNDLLTASRFNNSITIFDGGEEGVYERTLDPEILYDLGEDSWDLHRVTAVKIPQEASLVVLTGEHNNGTVTVKALIAHKVA